ncbi:MAG TPA: carboxymuconolactone decarboxylase family protein [Solirubrobacterales bacterium]|nr:carboxymuconolactone decarboxylase family protein [Solirubrobacterales bacterium]
MPSDTRIPKAEITGLYGGLVKVMSRRALGEVPESLGVMWHNRQVLNATYSFGRKTKKWNECDGDLKAFAHMAVSAFVGCAFCMDYGYFAAHNEGLDEAKLREVPRWRESDAFTPLERQVMEYAEAMSQTPPAVTDEMSARLLETLGAPALLELTAYIGMTNLTTRTNVALGIEAEGFSASCDLAPLAEPAGSVLSSA